MKNKSLQSSISSTSRFFNGRLTCRSFNSALSKTYVKLNMQIDPSKTVTAENRREETDSIIRQKYSMLKRHTFETESKFAYSLSNESPYEIIAASCFSPPKNEPRWEGGDPYHPDFGKNSGMVAFSFLPEVTALFAEMIKENSDKPLFMYAYLLNNKSGEVIFPGGRWRQVCIPGCLPIYETSFLLARELFYAQHDNKIVLGPIIDVTGFTSKWQNQLSDYYLIGERFAEYCEGKLIKPATRYWSEMDLDYDIADTPWTAFFQNETNIFYQQIFLENKCSNTI